MNNEIDWPIGEPIETDLTGLNGTTATILFIDGSGDPCGYIEADGIKWQTSWQSNGQYMTGDCDSAPNLIPPKRKPRTMGVWVDWKYGSAHATEIVPGPGTWIKHTIVHPDDVKPITREDIEQILLSNFTLPERMKAIMALLEERNG